MATGHFRSSSSSSSDVVLLMRWRRGDSTSRSAAAAAACNWCRRDVTDVCPCRSALLPRHPDIPTPKKIPRTLPTPRSVNPGHSSFHERNNVTASYTARWQRHMHMSVNNLPTVVTQQCPTGDRTGDLLIATPTPYRRATPPLSQSTWVSYIWNKIKNVFRLICQAICGENEWLTSRVNLQPSTWKCS